MEPHTLSCRATFSDKVASQVIPYLRLEWVGPDGVALNKDNGMTIEQQLNYHSEATRSLIFNPFLVYTLQMHALHQCSTSA